jgi:hypothetical protein
MVLRLVEALSLRGAVRVLNAQNCYAILCFGIRYTLYSLGVSKVELGLTKNI